MTPKLLWEQYQHYTHDLTDHGRKLGFAGSAICWFFKSDQFTFPTLIYLALLSFVAFFICDLLQGLCGALMIKFFTEHHEAKLWRETGSIEGDIQKPRWIDHPSFAFFAVKCVFLIIGFVFVGAELIRRLL